jgi:N-acetylglutamate synthase-like GNAT family acetyltransferase
MNIRRAETSDCHALTRIVRTSEAYNGEYRVMVADITITPEQVARDDLFVAEQDGLVIGFYSLKIDAEEAELDFMFVDDKLRGTGIGRALWSHMLARAQTRGFEAVKIVSHPPAEAFYRRLGARAVGVVGPSGRAAWSRPLMRINVNQGLNQGEASQRPTNPSVYTTDNPDSRTST